MTYNSKARTNHFKVADEEKYSQLLARLVGEVKEHSETDENGITTHVLCFGDNPFYTKTVETEEDYEFDGFFDAMQSILPDDEIFIYQHIGSEGYRYLNSYCVMVTNKEIKTIAMDNIIKSEAISMVGKEKAECIDMSY